MASVSVGSGVAVLVAVGVAVLVAVGVLVGAGVVVLVAVAVVVGVAVGVDWVMEKSAFEISKKILSAQATCTRAVVIARLGAVTLAEPLLATPVAKVVG